MGQAKRRGTFEQRQALAIERRKAEDARQEELKVQRVRERFAQAKANRAERERKEAVMVAGGGGIGQAELAALLGIAMGAASPLLVVDHTPRISRSSE